MPNQVEPGTMGGAPPESVSSGGAAAGAQTAHGGPEVLGGSPAGTLAQPGPRSSTRRSTAGPSPGWPSPSSSWASCAAGWPSSSSAWSTFWVGVGIAAVGGLLAAFTNIFEDWY